MLEPNTKVKLGGRSRRMKASLYGSGYLDYHPHPREESEQRKCIILLPCFNEEGNLTQLLSSIHGTMIGLNMPYEVVAVNDGSTDDTDGILRDLAEKYPIKIIRHDKNMGLAAVYRTSIDTSIRDSLENDVIFTMDADNTQDPHYIVSMLKEVENGTSIVIGSRYVDGGSQINVPFHRVVLSKIINLLIRKIAQMPIMDATSGYRCYKASVLRTASSIFKDKFIESQGFEVPLEVLVKTYRSNSGINMKEIPITLDYGKKVGKSKLKLITTINLYIRLLRKISAWRNQSRDFC